MGEHRIPPQNLDAEMSVLGAILIEPEAYPRVIEYIEAGDFYKKSHEKIFVAATEVFNRNEPIDVITVSNQLKINGQLNTCGGSHYLTQLVNNTVSAARVEYHAEIVKECSRKRKTITALTAGTQRI